MLKKLLVKLFDKLERERDNDKKTKNGNAIYFVERILEERFGKPTYISSRAIKGYYDKYVEGKENNSGEPSSELKDLIAKYLGFKDFLDFENTNSSEINTGRIGPVVEQNFKWFVLGFLSIILIPALYYSGVFRSEDCVVWKVDHYVIIECEGKLPNPILMDLNIEKFKKLKVSDTTTFFKEGKPIVWYGKSNKGEIEYFNSRGVHPITEKELKPISRYIINKYVYKKE
ncbi:MAG: hypothetical protein COB01_09690 [Lutibacter sp.]|nr:MAG: hypothetical protein COB01_09690 [Lutibacter sp.]